MKKLLSILAFALIFVGGVFAKSTVKVTVKLSSSSPNMGYVTYSTSNTSGESYTSISASKSNSSSGGFFGIGAKSTKPYYIFARTSDNAKYYFIGWSKGVDDPSKIDASISQNGYQVGGEYADGENKNVDEVYYAHFKEIKTWNIVLAQVASGGSYSVSHKLNGVQKSYTVNATSGDVNIDPFADPVSAEFTLNATPAQNYRFYRWCIDYGNGKVMYDNRSNPSLTVAESATISCEFISKDYAQFVVEGENNSYFKLSDAITAANVSTSKVVVLKESGKLYLETETNTYFDAEANKYTIPKGVTLLVPNSDNSADYKVQMNDLEEYDVEAPIAGESAPFKEIKCLTIDGEQNIEVFGDVCVYAKVTKNTGYVRASGRLHLGKNSKIVFKKGARLSVLGYITGDENSSVTIESEATVREVIQISDWRGGTMLSEIMGNSTYKVFPMAQYYVQNIETDLILHAGAIEYVSGVAEVSSMTIPMGATLISPKEGNYSGIFRLGEGTTLTKYYDQKSDRLKFDIKSIDGSADVSLDKIQLDLAKGNSILQIAISAILKTTVISSEQYILPINNNMDVRFYPNINVTVNNSIALLAGSSLTLDKGATIKISDNYALYVYDADEHHAQAMEAKGNFKKDYYYNYFGSAYAPILVLPGRPGGMVYSRTSKDLVEWTNPNESTNKTKLQKNDATIILNGSIEGQIYTTNGGASIISDDETANASVTFSNLKEQNIYQAIQYSNVDLVYGKIPCKLSAALKNADKTYSAGGDAATENGKTYTYYPTWDNGKNNPKGRWSDVLPDGVLTPMSLEGNGLTITLPEEKTASVTFTPQANPDYVKNINSVVVGETTFSGSRFAANGEVTFSNGVVTIPVKYTPTKTHNENITDANPEKVTVYFNCTNISEQSEVVPLEIPLTATQNYQPDFSINSETVDFGTVTVNATSETKTVKITPTTNNVTDRQYHNGNGYVTWIPTEFSVSTPFEITGGDYFNGVTIVYKPTTIDGEHSQTLTITAWYSDGVETEKTVTLQGTPKLASNPLAFDAESQEIYPGDVIDPLFSSIGNGEEIAFTYNGETTNDIIEIVPDGDNYKLQVKSGVNIITTQVIEIVAKQNENNVTTAGTSEIVVTVTPSVQWNWSKLYFGNTYENPIVVVNDEDWTLTYKGDCPAISSDKFTGNSTDGYTLQVGTGAECTATFTFKQGDYSVNFSAAVYADPRQLDMCVNGPNAERTYKDITIENTNVKYEDGIVFATTAESGAAWTMEIVGVPDKMEFIPTGDGKRWTIMEYDGATWSTTYAEAEIVLAGGKTHFVHNLKPSTQQIRIICSMGAEQGKITDLCVYALDASVSANMKKVYMPIVQDGNDHITESQENVVLSYVSPSSDLWLSMVDGDGNVVSDITLSGDNLVDDKLPATDVNNLYREETIVVSSTYATEGVVYLLVKDELDAEKLRLPIRLYNYPQPLPMRSAEWIGDNAEKYSFYTDFGLSQNVQYNSETQKLIFASTGVAQRFVTFVFRGGPSYISFESSLDFVPQDGITNEELVLQEWYDYWTLEVTDGESPRLVANSAEAEVQPEIEAEVRDGKTYYSIRIAIPYTTKSLTLQNKRSLAVEVENIVIDGEPDLDVVLGNHTIEHEATVNFMPDSETQLTNVTAINLEQLKVVCNNSHFTVKCGTINITSTPTTLTATECPNALGSYMVGDIALNIEWDEVNTVEEGMLIFTDKDGQELATIRLLGTKDFVLKGNSAETGLFTGFAEEITNHPFTNEQQKHKYARKEVNLSNAFDENGVALFDYLVVYGETIAEDRGTTITAPTTAKGSNARTPMYIYRKVQNSEGKYDRYQFVVDQANVNHGEKVALHLLVDAEGQPVIPHAKETDGTFHMDIAEGEQLRIYMTGFCPYASTGFEKTQEGVWLFRGKKNAKLDVYLEDCHIYSRNKTEDGHAYNGKNDPGADIFQEDYARGSGGVLVFECNDEDEYGDNEAFQVTIHTRGDNLLKSNYGCFYQILGMRAYQVSSPIQIRLTSDEFVENAKTHLTFDDKWPTDVADMAKFKRTNGFLSLLKQANNAPSIDMGNGNTVVNFRGGQVELQNAENVSDKYKTTLAISYRSGIMATGGLEIQMAYGIGTDAATKGIVNFYDGTTTVIPMYVDPADRKYYLMDTDAEGNELTTTSCLRCPQNTFVYGGSICMLRACMSPTSQGGAPTDGVRPLGRFFYKEEYVYEYNTADKTKPANHDDASQWLVNPVRFPGDIMFEGLVSYHNLAGYVYGIESVTPNEKGELILWIPDGFGGVNAEEDRYLTSWKACMPEISAVLAEVGVTTIGGTVGGPTSVENIEDVENLLYCQLDDEVYNVISETTGDDENYVYQAPLKIPEGFQMPGVDIGLGDYLRLAPSYVGGQDEHQMENQEDYKINNKIYYISSATADVWQTFTAPFDVENIWVVETFDETVLEALEPTEEEEEDGVTKRSKILKTQATHNADFAAFFGVAMALGSEQSFEDIYGDYIDWAKKEDGHSGSGKYTKRGKYKLIPYIGGNWDEAQFYINHNEGNWTIKNAEDGEFVPQWNYVEKQGNVLLKKGETYSLLFPYCVGCENEDEEREYWDYWTGKFIIFESTQASKDAPHIVRGSNYVGAEQPEKGEWVFPTEEVTSSSTEAIVTGNSTFAHMTTERSDVFVYDPEYSIETKEGKIKIRETFLPLEGEEYILPTTAFLLANPPVNATGARALSISRMGRIKYGSSGNNDDTPTGGHVPTIADGSDIFVMGTATGINIAVSEPQYVGVFSATGQLIYSGWVDTSVDVNLVVDGVYVVVGENESMKVIY